MSTTATKKPKDPDVDFALVESIDEWEEAGVHTPLLPSGRRVKMRVLDLPMLIEAGDIPQHLIDAAIGTAQVDDDDEKKTPSKEYFTREVEFTDQVCILSVVAPKLTTETVRRIPAEDRAMLAAWATRARDWDMEGEHIAGLNRSEKFRRFRGIGEFTPAVEDV